MKGPVPLFEQFSGINNVLPEQRLGPEDLVAAVNVTVDESKKLSRRAGSTVLDAGAAHSLWADGDLCLFRRGSSLIRMLPDESLATLDSGFVTSNPVGYAPIGNGVVYLSDGERALVTDGEETLPWGITPPVYQPNASAIAGLMDAGTYLYAVTFLRADGEESGAIEPGSIVLTQGQGIAFSSIPVSSEPAVVRKALYVTDPNGQVLRRAGIIPNAQTTANVLGAARGAELRTMLMIPPPPSNILAVDGGRMLLGFGSFLLYTDLYRYERYRPDENFVALGSAVRTIVPTSGGGVYVGTESGIVWLGGGDIAKASQKTVANYAALPGPPVYVDGALVGDGVPYPVPVIATTRGFVACLDDGQLQNLTIKRYWPPTAKWVSSAYVREAGKNRATFFFLT